MDFRPLVNSCLDGLEDVRTTIQTRVRSMQIQKFAFSELIDTPREWSVSPFSVDKLNLIVGRNAAGKSRIVNSIGSLASLIVKKPDILWESGSWSVDFLNNYEVMNLEVQIENAIIKFERVTVDGKILLNRDSDGTGSIWSDTEKSDLDFRIPNDTLAIYQKRDQVQHPFLEPLVQWGTDLKTYPFGSEFGKKVIWAATPNELQTPSDAVLPSSIAPEHVVKMYGAAYQRFQKEYDDALLRDLAAIGYECEDVGTDAMEGQMESLIPSLLTGRIPLVLFVKETDLPCKTRQFEMSMGMYRSLALLININYFVMNDMPSTIIVDDIGEGLDFERSAALVKLLISKCENSKIQLLMTSNDRFIMNEVDLKYWHIVERDCNRVTILDQSNSKESFEKFKFLGLSNFDFFSSKAYKSIQ